MEGPSNTTLGDILERLAPYIDLRGALEDAVKREDKDMVQWLIDFGLNVNGGTALVVAARYAQLGAASLDIMELLLHNGADINGGTYQLAPLQVLLSRHHESNQNCPCAQFTRFLLERGSFEKSKFEGGRERDLPPFLLAARNGHAEALHLLKNSESVKFKDRMGRTAFILATAGEAIECLKMLLSDFDVNGVDDNGWTALHWAVDKDSENIISWLLDHGADPQAENDEGILAIEGYEKLLKRNTKRSSQSISVYSSFNQSRQKVLEEMGVSQERCPPTGQLVIPATYNLRPRKSTDSKRR